MQLHYPFDPTSNAENPSFTWTQGNPLSGTPGSFPPYQAVVFPMEEIVNTITSAGLTASDSDLFQLYKAILAIIQQHPGPAGPAGAPGTNGANGANGTNAFAAPFLRLSAGTPTDYFYQLQYQNVKNWTNVVSTFSTSTLSNGTFTCGTGEGGLYFFTFYLDVGTVNLSTEVYGAVYCPNLTIEQDNYTPGIDQTKETACSGYCYLTPGQTMTFTCMQWNQENAARKIAQGFLNITRIPN